MAAALTVYGCGWGEPDAEPPPPTSDAEASAMAALPDIVGANAFYYYADVGAAWAFYRDVLGFETVADFGFAKIMRVAPASYLTLVDEAEGMHSSDEPKSVTLAVVTEQVERWYDYLTAEGVPMRAELGTVEPGRAHDGFVAIDPEGYLLEFERFNPHAENTALMPMLDAVDALGPTQGSRPEELTVEATVLWLYYADIPGAQAFYEETLGTPLVVDQGWAKVYRASRTGFIGLVDGARGLHQATEEKAVTVSFFTSDAAAWLARARGLGIELRAPELGEESGRVATFVGYDPERYFLEWDTVLDVEENERLLTVLRAETGGN
jgi:catechol 2,3-dioxygenase-like lactoylglutathione lyase family enzyme